MPKKQSRSKSAAPSAKKVTTGTTNTPPKTTQAKTQVPRPPIPIASLAKIRPATTLSGFYDPSASTNEVRYRITDYFDSVEEAYQQYLFDQSTVLLSTGAAGVSANLVRVNSVKVFALPLFSVSTKASSVIVAFSLPVSLGGEQKATCQRTTLLTPTSVSNWVLVGSWKSKTVFKDALYTPAFNSTGLQAIASLAVLDCDTLQLASAQVDQLNRAVQYRIEYELSATLPLVTTVKGTVPTSTAELWDNAAEATSGDIPVLVQVLGMSNIA